MKYKCQICGFIHEGEMPDGYFCPLCRHGSFYFDIIDEEEKVYNRVLITEDNNCINRIEEKCINCGICTKTCLSLGNINQNEEKSICIGCGQCILTCPKSALTPKYDYNKVMDYINDDNYLVAVMTSPAVRVSIGDAFGFEKGEFLENKLVGVLKNIGFDYVFDTTFGADLTSMEEAYELKERLENNQKPMFSSCCPSWVKYAKMYHPEIIDNISTCKSPIGMESTILKEYFAKEEELDKKLIVVALTPCTSKKDEIKESNCDYVITTSELALLIRELNIDFKSIKEEEFDEIKGSSSGCIYGGSKGVTISVLRVLYNYITNKDLKDKDILIINKGYYDEIKLKVGKQIIKCACVSTLKNLEQLLKIKDEFDFIEVMNCDGGCISGGGQILTPIADKEELKIKRATNLNKVDKNTTIKYPYNNPIIIDLYEDFLKEKGNHLLHLKHK